MRCFKFIFIISAMILLSSCMNLLVVEGEVIKKNNDLLSGAELIDNENSHLIGVEVNDDTPFSIVRNPSKASNGESFVALEIPDNIIVRELANDSIPPSSIINFEATNGTSPEIIMTNGSAVVFTKEDLNGWTCKVGDKLIYKFEKYESDVSSAQKMIIGYVLDGVLSSGEVVKELSGEYQLDIAEEGDYYIYVISATSDYLALKQGTISIVSNEKIQGGIL